MVSKLFHEHDVAELYDFFIEAAYIEQILPAVFRKQKLSYWPDHKIAWDAYGWDSGAKPQIRASAKQIDHYDKALELSSMINLDDRKLIWAVAHSSIINDKNKGIGYRERGPNWHRVAKIMAIDHRTVRRKLIDAVIKLYYQLQITLEHKKKSPVRAL